MDGHFRTIAVFDGNGDQLSLYEFREPALLFGLVRQRRYHLCTGELVRKKGGDLVIASTGEELKRVKSDQ